MTIRKSRLITAIPSNIICFCCFTSGQNDNYCLLYLNFIAICSLTQFKTGCKFDSTTKKQLIVMICT